MEAYRKFSLFSAFVIALIIFYVSSLSFIGGTGGQSFLPKTIIYHLGIYFFLGFFLLLSSKFSKQDIFLVFLICFVYAILDELHQSFVPGRVASMFDIGIDGLGILISFYVLFFIKIARKRIHRIDKNVRGEIGRI